MVYQTAVYLIGHGPYREPRFVELQYLRILRYSEALSKKLQDDFVIKDVYIDLNFPRSSVPYELPEFRKLIFTLANGEYSSVLIDIDTNVPFYQYSFSPMTDALKATGAKVYNCFYDDEDAMATEFIKWFGESARYYSRSSDPEDIMALFPALAARVSYEVLENILGENWNGSIDSLSIVRTIDHLRSENPYTRTQLPLLSSRKIHHLNVLREEEQAKRRLTETLFILGPEQGGQLIDEGLFGYKPRNDTELLCAEERLSILKFEKEKSKSAISYYRDFQGFRIFADPRAKGRINFYVYQLALEPKPKGRRAGSKPVEVGRFCIMDSWKNGLEEKFQNRVGEIIKATSKTTVGRPRK